MTKAKNVLKYKLGTVNPVKENPLNKKALIEIFAIKIVKRYRIIKFITKEKAPNVIKFRGRDMMFKIGFKSRNIMYKAIPPKK